MKKIKAKTVIAMRKCSEVLCNWLPVYIISYTAYNCPNTEKYWVNKIHIGRDEIEPDMNKGNNKITELRTILQREILLTRYFPY